MLKATTSRTKRLVRRFRRIWSELAYAQRRLFEIRTGVSIRATGHPKISRSIDELERLYAA